MSFEPIAIVGQACLLPDAATPDTLWLNVLAERNSLGAAPEGRWRMPREMALQSAADGVDHAWNDVGGYVQGFSSLFDAHGFRLDHHQILALDPLFQWTLHGVREALRDAGRDYADARCGLVMGNLSFPSAGMARFAEHTWLSAQTEAVRAAFSDVIGQGQPDPHNRFSSGYPAHLAVQALGFGDGFALDAACASSLYAIKLACDRLHERSADLMVAGAVNCTDDLFIHMGFTALSALSRSGRSRPFHRDADGLVPAEGAAFVTLKRLDDAIAARDRIHGVIRGVGLSNDGRARGLLVPSSDGQIRAIRQAWNVAGLAPQTASLIECHATGTELGDSTEVHSMAEVFGGIEDLPIGSLKSNFGHLITVAGIAGLIKVLGAMKAGVRPATLHADAPLDALDGTPLRLLLAPEAWTGQRRAGISAFGFGGNNAHLIVDAWDGKPATRATSPAYTTQPTHAREPVAIVALGARVTDGRNVQDLVNSLLSGDAHRAARVDIEVQLSGLRFPPHDIRGTLPQQLMMLEAGREACHGIQLPRERTQVLIGMGCDADIARSGARWRAPSWLAGRKLDAQQLNDVRAAIQVPLTAAGVLGTMPNIVANRLNSQLDLAGPSFSVSAEEASGIVALQLAVRDLQTGEADAAVVGAVDLSHEPVHRAALQALDRSCQPGDAAVALVLKRLVDARRDGDTIMAVLGGDDTEAMTIGDSTGKESCDFDPAHLFGRAHAAQGLMAVASAVLAISHRARPQRGAPASPWLGRRSARVTTAVLGAQAVQIGLSSANSADGADSHGWSPDAVARVHIYSGADQTAALAALNAGLPSDTGPARLVIAAAGPEQFAARASAARGWLRDGGPRPEGVAFRATPVHGEIAFVFTGAAAAYPGMGRELMLALPRQLDAVEARAGSLDLLAGWLFGGPERRPRHPLDQLWGATIISQLHAEITRRVLGIRPHATLGYSSGETNALFAMEAWRDVAAMIADTTNSPLFRHQLVPEFSAVREAWQRRGTTGDEWHSYSVHTSLEQVRSALDGETAAHLTAINAPGAYTIGGEAQACARVLTQLPAGCASFIPYEMAVHAPELEIVRDAWHALHHRTTDAVPGVRFYGCGSGQSYTATADAAADAITAQAIGTLDFERTVEQAWVDGVRIFIEHGPRNACSGWISRILGAREHLAVPLDVVDRSSLRQLNHAVVTLVAAGVTMDLEALFDLLAQTAPVEHVSVASISVPAHWPAITLPDYVAGGPQVMKRAPWLPSVLGGANVTPPMPATAMSNLVPTPAPVVATPMFEAALAGSTLPPSLTATRPTVPANFASTPDAPMLRAQKLSPQQRAAVVHKAFIERQTAIHLQFLALQKSAEASFLQSMAAAMQASETVASYPVQIARFEAAVSTPAHRPGIRPAQTRSADAGNDNANERANERATLEVALEIIHPGPKFDREDLERLASGKISTLFGPQFEPQDVYARQTRMPMPPLLLADRVTGIDADAGSMSSGTIWTETDVERDSWYLTAEGRMPAGVMIEAGQADLLLISWLGIDLLNRGARVYRLLGCDLTFHGSLPVPGETLVYSIHIDSHARQGDVRMFFFHYDCHVNGELRMSVRQGQAGFFTDEELDNSSGVQWDAHHETCDPHTRVDAPAALCVTRDFDTAAVLAFAAGRLADCFGAPWEAVRAHVRTPRVKPGDMLFLDRIRDFDPHGGPWQRGYLRSETAISPDDWFFPGHFKNDPCMPGTLMFEGCLQAMAFYMSALGFTIERDGWRFEPVSEESYRLRCRGQVRPTSRLLTCEVFISEVISGPIPTIYADLLGTVDGVKSFHAKRVGLKLVPDWPLDQWRDGGPPVQQTDGATIDLPRLGGLRDYGEPKPVAVVDGFTYDYASLMACAWGKPSDAFGPFYEPFDGARTVARLPGPPYHFMSRILDVSGPQGGMKSGSRVEAEYTVPDAVWYFEQSAYPTMPLSVLMEVALQPCGWLASYVGSALTSSNDLLFRNLDGSATILGEVGPHTKAIRTKVELTSISRNGDMIIESFVVECFADGQPLFKTSTVFGFFPKDAFENQVGMPPADTERAIQDESSPFQVDLRAAPARYCGAALRMPKDMLLMLDRVSGYWPEGGKAGLGRLRAEKDIEADDWFFKAHFFQDPVQPGSLGIEAIYQLLQFYMIVCDLGAGIEAPRFELYDAGKGIAWKYRGQVVPTSGRVWIDLEVLRVDADARGPFAIADAWLWVDDKRIYQCRQLGLRVVPSTTA